MAQPSRDGMVIFDLDGTLTVPILDFDAIRAEIGLPPGPILESLAGLAASQRVAANEVLHRHERDAAYRAEMQPGARETVKGLRRLGWPVAILTRNARRWSKVVLDRFGIEVDALCTRDDGVIKPSPSPVLELCREAGRAASASWMIGDHLFDIQSGRAAGCATVLLVSDHTLPEYASQADHVIRQVHMVLDIVTGNGEPRAHGQRA